MTGGHKDGGSAGAPQGWPFRPVTPAAEDPPAPDATPAVWPPVTEGPPGGLGPYAVPAEPAAPAFRPAPPVSDAFPRGVRDAGTGTPATAPIPATAALGSVPPSIAAESATAWIPARPAASGQAPAAFGQTPTAPHPAGATPATPAPVTPSWQPYDALTAEHRSSPAATAPAPAVGALGVPAPSAEVPPPAATPPSRASRRVRRRSNLPLIVASVAAVLVLAGVLVTAWAVGLFDGEPTGVIEASPTQTPTPTESQAPAISPAPKEDGSVFFDALPLVVLDHVYQGSEVDEETVAAGAVEAYTLSYADGLGSVIEVSASQWPVAELAGAHATALAAADAAGQLAQDGTDNPAHDEVDAGGQQVGSSSVAVFADGTAAAVWTNLTAAFRVSGPADATQDFFLAFPL